MTTREKVDYRDRAELDENLDYRDENTEGREEHQTEHPNSSYQAANQHMVKFNDELKVINEQTSLDFEFRKNPAEYDLAERSLTPVLVDGLDPVSVVSTVLYRIVGVGGRRRSRVRHQLIEVALGVVVAVAPEDHVPGDAVVAGVVPGERHLVMGSRGVQAGGLGRYRHFQGFDVEPAGPLAHPVLVDGLDAVGVVSAGRYRVVGVGGRRCARVSHQFTELAPGIVHADAPQDLVRMIRLRDEEGNATTYLSNLIDRSRRAV